MRLHNLKEVNLFLDTASKCKGDVFLRSPHGDQYNLKSELTKYVAIAELIGDNAEELELWCSSKNDEALFLKLLSDHKEILKS